MTVSEMFWEGGVKGGVKGGVERERSRKGENG